MKKILLLLLGIAFYIGAYAQVPSNATKVQNLATKGIYWTDGTPAHIYTGYGKINDTTVIYFLDSVKRIMFTDGTVMTTSLVGDTNTLQQVLDKSNTSTTGFEISGSSLIGTGSTSSFAILTLNSTTKGFMIPRMTIVQRLAMADAENGTQVYDTDLHAVFIKEGENWIQ